MAWLRQIPVRAARLRGVPHLTPIDGKVDTTLPLASPLQIELARAAPIAYVEMESRGALGIQWGDRGNSIPSPGPLARFLPAEPVKLRRVTLLPEEGAALSEARFYECSSDAPPRAALAMEPVPAEGAAPAILLSTGPLARAAGPTAVVLDLELGAPFPEVLRARLTHSGEPDRAWFGADLQLAAEPGAGSGRWVAVLDPPDTWCAAGESVTLSLAPTAEGAAAAVVRSAHAWVATGDPGEIRDDIVLSRLQWLGAWYAEHAAEAPWERPEWDPGHEPALRWLATLREWQPQHPGTVAYARRLLRFRHEAHVPASGPENAPMWARLARQLLKRTQDVAYWWQGTRQQKDGLYGDDARSDAALVEKLATVPLIAGHPVLLRGTRAGCEGVWREASARAGGSPGGSDAAVGAWIAGLSREERRRWLLALAQTQSLLMLVDPGSAVPLRRSLPLARDLATRIVRNSRGHRHFRDNPPSWGEGAPAPGDIPANAACAGPALAYFWHTGHPGLGSVLGEWAAAWAADILGSINLKDPAGIPSEVGPTDCRAVAGTPPAAAADARALRRLLLDAHRLSGNAQLLRPVALAVGAGAADPLTAGLWRSQASADQDERLVRASQGADDLRAHTAWLATRNKQFLVEGLQNALDRLDAERYLATQAGLSPEAVEVPGDMLLRFLYLGGCATWQGGMPRLAVTWEGTGVDFAAFVAQSRRDALKVLLYHFRPEERQVQMRVWALRAGRYLLESGPDANYDDAPDRVTDRRVIEVERGTAVPITLPSQQPFVVRLAAKALRPDTPLPDVALCADEVSLSPDRLRVTATVRNFGTASAPSVRVTVTDERSQAIGSAMVARLPWPQDLRPAATAVEIPLKRPAPPAFRVTASVSGEEISMANNSAVLVGR